MDFEQTVCKPRNPLCDECGWRNECQAFQHGWVNQLPVKEKILKRKERWFTYYVVLYKNQVYIRKRSGKDIWANLFEFILKESSNADEQSLAISTQFIESVLGTTKFHLRSVSPFFKQELTHQTIRGQFVTVVVDEPVEDSLYTPIQKSELNKYPFPKLINTFLEQQ
jgi:A/G-specific adenine glycosylase